MFNSLFLCMKEVNKCLKSNEILIFLETILRKIRITFQQQKKERKKKPSNPEITLDATILNTLHFSAEWIDINLCFISASSYLYEHSSHFSLHSHLLRFNLQEFKWNTTSISRWYFLFPSVHLIYKLQLHHYYCSDLFATIMPFNVYVHWYGDAISVAPLTYTHTISISQRFWSHSPSFFGISHLPPLSGCYLKNYYRKRKTSTLHIELE